MTKPLNVPITAQVRYLQAGVPFTPDTPPICTIYLLPDGEEVGVILLEDEPVFDVELEHWFSYTLPAINNTVAGKLQFDFTTPDTDADDEIMSAFVEVSEIAEGGGSGASVSDIYTANPENYDTLSTSFAARFLAQGLAIGHIGAANVEYIGAVSTTGRVIVYQDKDYLDEDSTALEWHTSSMIDLIGATVVLNVANGVFEGEITGISGEWVIKVDMTADDTGSLLIDTYGYELSATLSNGHFPPPIAVGILQVVRKL